MYRNKIVILATFFLLALPLATSQNYTINGNTIEYEFNQTGSPYDFEIPQGVNEVNFTLRGAGGGDNGIGKNGGDGGTTNGTQEAH